MSNRLLALAATAAFATTASAQFCSDNTYPVHIVDAAGAELPIEFDANINENTFLVPTEDVFLAFDPNLPTGTYYVHVTDTPLDGMDEVVSENDPMDRFVHVDNTAGVITLSFPFSSNPGNIVVGDGLNGVGQSLLINPFRVSQFSACNFKVFYGDVWDLTNGPENPYLLAGGLNPMTGGCAVRSYHSFRVGDGSGGDVTGAVFSDDNSNGVQDAGELGLAGWDVNLVDGTNTVTVQTDANGDYVFENVGAGSFTVELTLQSGFDATTATTNAIEACACASKFGGDFGVAQQTTVCCNARTTGYWRNCHGRQKVQELNLLQTLPALCIVNTCGQQVAPATIGQYAWWMRRANSWNMAYSLSAQVVAMHNNIAAGYVSTVCVINDPCLGIMTVEQLLQQAVVSLCANPYTPPCTSERSAQRKLKNALSRANKNLIWQSAPSCAPQGGCGPQPGNCGQQMNSPRRWRGRHRRGGC